MELPEKVNALFTRIPTFAMATVRPDGAPNVVAMARKYWYKNDRLIIGDMFMKATKQNVEENGRVSLCIWDDASGESYKLIGTGRYEDSGEALEIANQGLQKDKPGKKFKGVVIFEPWRDNGYGHFMHISAKFQEKTDTLSDPKRDDQWGGEYGPYVMSRFTTGTNRQCRIYYTMSTWNPYQVVVMRSDLHLGTEVK